MTIMLALDESAHSREALGWVGRMNWPAATEVVVVSVARSPMILSTETYAPGLSYDDETMKAEVDFRVRLANEAVENLKAKGLAARTRVVTGDPRLEIIDLARKERVDLIVMGSHGRTGLAKLLLGSVAAHVVSHAPCSVMVVKGVAAPG